MDHFREIYKKLDPGEIALRCGLPFCPEEPAFALRIMGTGYMVPFPDFDLRPPPEKGPPRPFERILFLRYLCEGKYAPPQGKRLSYREIPWGEVYYRNFEGRCIQRLAHSFGRDLGLFRRIMEGTPALRAQQQAAAGGVADPLTHLDYRFEFCSGFSLSFLIWAADEEFPPSAQILFDDNIPAAFTAEDLAAACGVAVDHLKDRAKDFPPP
jgi:hypothetical protein